MYNDRWDIYEQEKEFFTIATIKDELRKKYRFSIGALVCFVIFSPIMYISFRIVVLLPIAYFSEYEPGRVFNIILLCVFLIGMLGFIIFYIIQSIKFVSTIKKNEFQITTDKVIKIIPMSLGGSRTAKLIFEHNGAYSIHLDTLYYPWSLFYNFTGEYIIEHTSLEDEFYVVSIRKHKASLAYSKKHFELKE